MRKLTAIGFALLIATSAVASPRNESQDPNPIMRLVRQIKSAVVHVLDDIQPTLPTPH